MCFLGKISCLSLFDTVFFLFSYYLHIWIPTVPTCWIQLHIRREHTTGTLNCSLSHLCGKVVRYPICLYQFPLLTPLFYRSFLPVGEEKKQTGQVLSLKPAGRDVCGYGCEGSPGAKGPYLQRASRLISYSQGSSPIPLISEVSGGSQIHSPLDEDHIGWYDGCMRNQRTDGKVRTFVEVGGGMDWGGNNTEGRMCSVYKALLICSLSWSEITSETERMQGKLGLHC